MASKVEKHFGAILDLVASGLPIERALKSRPEFPIKATWKCYAYDKRFPERRARLNEASEQGRIEQAKRYKSTVYSDADFDRSLKIIFNSDPDIRLVDLEFGNGPGYATVCTRARREPEFDRRFTIAKRDRRHGGRDPKYSDEDYERALALVKRVGVRGLKKDGDSLNLPCRERLHNRSNNDQQFARRYQNALSAASLTRIAYRAPSQHYDQLKSSLLSNSLYSQISRRVSPFVDPDSREDIISDMVADVLSGDLAEDEIAARCASYVRQHNRQLARHRVVSIDVPIFDSKSQNILDRLTTDPVESWGM
jgi:hypothetical protein